MDRKLALFAIFETLGTVSWFLKDSAWMHSWKPDVLIFAIAAALFTAVASIFAFLSKLPLHQRLGAITVNCWLAMNVFWMLSDQYELVWAFPVGVAFNAIGIVGIAATIVVSAREGTFGTTAIFGRFRIPRTPPSSR